jgi:hypothetical protein
MVLSLCKKVLLPVGMYISFGVEDQVLVSV